MSNGEVIVRPFTSIKSAYSKQTEMIHYKAITSIKLMTQDDVFKCYVNKAILLSHFKKISHLMSAIKLFFSSRKVPIMYTFRVVLEFPRKNRNLQIVFTINGVL